MSHAPRVLELSVGTAGWDRRELRILFKSGKSEEGINPSVHRRMSDLLRQQLLDTTRGRIVDLLQSGGLTADDLATRLGVSKSAVRVQLTAMERDGVVVRAGKRPGTTRPSYVFELTPESRRYLSKAYLPLLLELVGELETSLPSGQLRSVLRRAGKRLAHGLSGGRKAGGDLRARVTKASELMNTQLGAQTHVERNSH